MLREGTRVFGLPIFEIARELFVATFKIRDGLVGSGELLFQFEFELLAGFHKILETCIGIPESILHVGDFGFPVLDLLLRRVEAEVGGAILTHVERARWERAWCPLRLEKSSLNESWWLRGGYLVGVEGSDDGR